MSVLLHKDIISDFCSFLNIPFYALGLGLGAILNGALGLLFLSK
jgi:hypothetical protein